MKSRRFTLNVTLVIAATLSLQFATYAAADYVAADRAAADRAAIAAIPATNLEGQTFFSHPPRLVRTVTSENGSDTPSTYEFTLTLPKDAGQPLKAVTIAQAPNLETVRFDSRNSQAFLGNRVAAGHEISLARVGNEQSTNAGEATVVFAQPVQPGRTVTLALAVHRNPNLGGVYEFGVTAYPEGENGLGQFLGYGRINFYSY